jgi:hypothetical protein
MGANEWEKHMSDLGHPYYYISRDPPPSMMMGMLADPPPSLMMGIRQVGLAGGLHPIRPGAEKCTFYIRTGSCKFGETCKFDHPPEMLGVGAGGTVTRQSGDMGISRVGTAGSSGNVRQVGLAGGLHPIRPGAEKCTFYIHTGCCKFGESCKFDHPPEMLGVRAGGAVTRQSGFKPVEIRQERSVIAVDDSRQSTRARDSKVCQGILSEVPLRTDLAGMGTGRTADPATHRRVVNALLAIVREAPDGEISGANLCSTLYKECASARDVIVQDYKGLKNFLASSMLKDEVEFLSDQVCGLLTLVGRIAQ